MTARITYSTTARVLLALCAIPLCALTLATSASAQKPLSLYLASGPTMDRSDRKLDGGFEHVLVGAELSIPILPLALRVDGMRTFFPSGKGGQLGHEAVTVNGVFLVRLPIVQPYAIAGYGRYGVMGGDRTDGVNAGIGMRIVVGPLGAFVEARRHSKLSRDLLSVGLVF